MSQDLIKALRTARIMHNADQQELVCLPPADFKVIRDHIEALSRHRSSVESVELPKGDGVASYMAGTTCFTMACFNPADVKEGDHVYTASTVRSLIAAAVERATEEANRRANASWSLMVEKMVAIEREQCAKVCDGVYYQHIGPLHGEVRYGIAKCAAAIRARGEK